MARTRQETSKTKESSKSSRKQLPQETKKTEKRSSASKTALQKNEKKIAAEMAGKYSHRGKVYNNNSLTFPGGNDSTQKSKGLLSFFCTMVMK